MTVNTKDGKVDGNKFGSNLGSEWEMPKFDSSDNSYTWTIKVSPSTYATDLVISDKIGSSLEYVPDSFTLVDANGNPVSGKCDASIDSADGSKVSISLGDLPKGTYYVQYKTTVKQSALDALKDGQELDGVRNSASWTWGLNHPNSSNTVQKDPEKVKYVMVSKSASGTNDNIAWTVRLNTGSLKADMSKYHFSDELGDGHSFKEGTLYVVKNSAGDVVASGNVDSTSKNLDFDLPDGIGKQELTVTYFTSMDDTSSPDPVSNTSRVTPSNGEGVTGEGSATYEPTDDRTYITKHLVDKSTVESDGKASWESLICFSQMSKTTDPEKVKFTDEIKRDSWEQIKFENIVLKVVSSGETLEAGLDYRIDPGDKGDWGKLVITFTNSTLVKSLLGEDDVSVTYTTVCSGENGVYTNTSSLEINNLNKGSANDSYTIDKTVIPEVSKQANGTWWDANYSWGEGESKGAWITNWNVSVNKTFKAGKTVSAVDLKGQPIVISDTMDEGMTYVDGSAGYNLVSTDDESLSKWQQSFSNGGNISVQDGKAVFTIPTDAVTTENGSTNAYAELWYRTAVKPSSVDPGASKEFANTAEAQAGETTFPAGVGKTTITNNVLDKTSVRASDNSHVTYTIKVNPNALDIDEKSDVLTLVDVMDSGCSFTNGSLHVMAGGADITNSITYSLENVEGDNGSTSTKLTLVVPDSTSLVITYDVAPQGALDEEVIINNTVSMDGFKSAVKPTSGKWKVQKSNAGTEAESYGITVKKTDDTGKVLLKGAKFSLHQVDLDSSTTSDIKATIVDGYENVETNEFGIASFGTEEAPLKSGVLYYFVETEPPSGYEITNTKPTYVMFSGATEEAKADYTEAFNKAKALGITPNAGTSFGVYDKKKDDTAASGTATLSVQKKVNGVDPADDASFDFRLSAIDGAPMPASGGDSVTTVGKDPKNFGSITFDTPGTYKYKIEETPVALDDENIWTTAKPVYALVEVGNASDGSKVLPASVKYYSDEDCKQETSDTVAVFNNTYVTPKGSATINVVKQVNGNDPADNQIFEFSIDGRDEVSKAKMPESTTATTTGAAIASFGKVDFTKQDIGKTYHYVIAETSGLSDAWTKAGPVDVTVSVGTPSDDAPAAIPVTVEYSSANSDKSAALFNNIYKHEEKYGSFVLAVNKKVVCDSAPTGQKFTFTAKAVGDNADQAPKLDADSAEITDSGDASFTAIDKLTEEMNGETFAYAIHEEGTAPAGWTYDAKDVTAEVAVSIDGSGTPVAQVSYKKNGEAVGSATFTNTYTSATGSFSIDIQKTVNGSSADGVAKGFKFAATAIGDNAGEAPVLTSEEAFEATTNADGKASFSGSLKESNMGKIYQYVISETSQLGDGWKKADDQTVTVKVANERSDDGSIVAIVQYPEGASAFVFSNAYEATGSATLFVVKLVNGESPADDQSFSYEMTPIDGAPMPDGKGSLATNTLGSAASSFDSISFGLDDAGKTYKYRIHETTPQTVGWTMAGDVIAKVTVGSDQGNGTLGASTVEYVKAENEQVSASVDNRNSAALFNNKYQQASGKFQLGLTKTVNDNAPLQGESFEFAATAIGENATDAPKLDNVTTSENGEAKFAEAALLDKDAGETYTYRIHEVSDLTDGSGSWNKAPDVIATVKVSDRSSNNELTATVTYKQDSSNAESYEGAAKFNNEYRAQPVYASIAISKTVNGGALLQGESFTFQLTDNNGNQIGEEKTISGNDAEASTTFATPDLTEPGEYIYWVKETSSPGENWTNDAPIKVVVKVGVEGKRDLKVESVKYFRGSDELSNAVFNNVHADKKAEAVLKVDKTVNGEKVDDLQQKFSFQLQPKDDAPMPEGDGADSVMVDGTGTGEFSKISYGEAGTYEYIIHESSTADGAWFNAVNVEAKVTVGYAENGRDLEIKGIEYSNSNDQQDAALFDNAYAPASANIWVKKTVNGEAAPADKHFTFELQAQDDAPMPSEATADTFGGDTCSFDGIEFTAEGEYRYVIHETADLGEGWTNAADVPVTVKVVRDEDAKTLKVESVDYGDSAYKENGQAMALFDNKYDAPEQPDQPKGDTPDQPNGDMPNTDQPENQSADGVKTSGIKTGDNLALVGGAVALVAIAAAGVAVFALRRRKN